MSELPSMIVIKRRYVHQDIDRHGNVRTYLWRRGQRKVRVRAPIGSEEFDKTYHDWLNLTANAVPQPAPSSQPRQGTFRWLVVEHHKSVSFKQLDPRTQHVTKLITDKMLLEPIAPGARETFADCPLDRFDAKAVRILRDRRADRPEAANNRLRRLRQIFQWSMETGIPGVEANPARDVPTLRPSRVGGFPAWRPEDIERFERHHPIGSKARLAFALLLYTGVRRSDVVQLGCQHMRGDMLVFRQHKGRKRSPLTLELPILPVLQQVIDASSTGDLTFLMTEHAKPFTAAGFGNWFRQRCNQAGLHELSAHGLRKAGATRAAENGASAHQLMAIFGWRALRHAEGYTRGAERKRLAKGAMHLLMGTNEGQMIPTAEPQRPKVRESET